MKRKKEGKKKVESKEKKEMSQQESWHPWERRAGRRLTEEEFRKRYAELEANTLSALSICDAPVDEGGLLPDCPDGEAAE
jgi:hypothetical protein